MVQLLGEDGLSWLPSEPWAAPWGAGLLLAGEQSSARYAEVSWAQRGTLMGLLSRLLRTGDERYLERARRLVDGLQSIAQSHPDGLFFPEGYWRSDGWHQDQPGLCQGLEETNAAVIVPAVRLYEATGYEPALRLAEGLARFALKHTRGYRANGEMVASSGTPVEAHFHTRSCFVLGILKLGLVLGHREWIAWARQGYAAARAWGTDFGWFPEHLGNPHAEICGTVDMIEIALLLGGCVDPAYYADAERFGRNHLLESQFLSRVRLDQALQRLPPGGGPAPNDGAYSTWDDVPARQVGGFASRPALNDGFHPDAAQMMQCCNASGTRALYDLWSYAVDVERAGPDQAARVAVNLRFSVETPWLRVVSHEPAEGHLELTATAACHTLVRLPSGVPDAFLVRGVGAASRVQLLPAHGGAVDFGQEAGEAVDVFYRLPERIATYQVGVDQNPAACPGYWRGETLMRVEPAGLYYPLYGRSADLSPVVPGPAAGEAIPSI
jgi:hypothetical protein